MFINLLDINLQEWILDSSDKTTDIKTTLETIMKEGPPKLQNNLANWKIEDVDGRKAIFYKGRNCIPDDQGLWQDVVKMFYDHKTARHPGELEMYNWVRQYYWWPGLWTFIKTYVQGCRICQQFKINRSPSHPAYQPIEGANTTCPFANCSMNLITNLPPINGYDSIFVMVNQGLGKGVILCPCAKTITWEGISELLQDNLSKRFRLPNWIISDWDPRYAARAFRELLKLLNIMSSLSTAYHP